MGDQIETIEIRRVHDNDKYIITRKIVEDVSGAELVKVYNDIDKAFAETQKQLVEIPKQVAERTKALSASLETLKIRRMAFEEHASKLGAVKPEDAPASPEEPKEEGNGN